MCKPKLDFISEDNLKEHIKNTISNYGERLDSFDLNRFNKNIIDPIKLIFDKSVYKAEWKGIIESEIFRQRDKSNNNSIGYFHQNIFKYIKGCTVPDEGWDVIYTNENGITIDDTTKVHTIYVEMKNKHNTMNSASASKTYIKMQNQLLKDDDCACFLVEAISKKSQNARWETTIDKNRVSHKFIRRVSIDRFYEIVTGDEKAFYKLCIMLPDLINDVIKNTEMVDMPDDTVLEELKNIAVKLTGSYDEQNIMLAIYMLGFGTYLGFEEINNTYKLPIL